MNNPRDNIRQHILDTAKPIILGKGFTAVGLNEILAAAAVPKGSFYHYFKSKEMFGEAMLGDYFADYLAHIDTVLSNPELTGAQRLLAYWQAWLDTSLEQEGQCQCLAVKLGAEVSDLSEPMRLALQQGTDHIIAKLTICIRAGIEDGSLTPKILPEHCALTLYQMWLGASLLSKIRRAPNGLQCAMLSTRKILHLE
jgi:TetR/AcrR family transcriptional repressor of nem operon